MSTINIKKGDILVWTDSDGSVHDYFISSCDMVVSRSGARYESNKIIGFSYRGNTYDLGISWLFDRHATESEIEKFFELKARLRKHLNLNTYEFN
jgi:hypothetical protein